MLDLLIVVAFVVYAIGSGCAPGTPPRRTSKSTSSPARPSRAGRPGLDGRHPVRRRYAAPGETAGIFALWRLWIYALAFLLMAYVFALGWRRGGVLTGAELTGVRYSGLPLRVLKAIYYGTVINCVVLAMVLVAAIHIAEVFLPCHDWLPAGLYQPITAFVAAIGLQLGESVTGLPPEVATTTSLNSILLILLFTAT